MEACKPPTPAATINCRARTWLVPGVALMIAACGGEEPQFDDLTGHNEASLYGYEPNGNPVYPTSGYPEVGVIVGAGRICSGVLVAPRIVMTTASCIKGIGRVPDGFFTGPGSEIKSLPSNLSTLKGLKRHALDRYAVHPDFKGTAPYSTVEEFRNNVALVRLKSSAGITPLKISAINPKHRQWCATAAYGYYAGRPTWTAKTFMRKRSATRRVDEVDSHNISVYFGGGQMAAGDTGSPLICSGKVYGIANFRQGKVDYYQRTQAGVRAWIGSVAKAWKVSLGSTWALSGDPSCKLGIRGGRACCAKSCGKCGGTGCGHRPGGVTACCAGRVLASERPCSGAKPPCVRADPTCALGLKSGRACCPKSCGKCGGTGCGKRPGGASACCAGSVLSSGKACAAGVAPCIVY